MQDFTHNMRSFLATLFLTLFLFGCGGGDNETKNEGSSMTSTVFTQGTVIEPSWLNDVNAVVYGGGSSTTPLKVAILGDSMVTTNEIVAESVSAQIEHVVNGMGGYIQVRSFGRDAHTFFRANNTVFINSKTSVQALVAAGADVVLVPLGLNDAINNVDGRTLAQTKADADATFAALRAGLPSAKIYYVAEVPYDTVNFSPSTLKNKGVIPSQFTLRASGILTGKYSTEILDDAVSAGTKTLFQNWADLNTYVKANANLTGSFDFKLWRVARMGGAGLSGLHLNAGGNIVATGYFVEGLRAITPQFSGMFSNNFDVWEKPDYLFSQMFTSSGDGYTFTAEYLSSERDSISFAELRPTTWYLPRESSATATLSVVNNGSTIYAWSIQGAKPNTAINISVNGAAFVSIGVSTNAVGAYTESALGSVLSGTFTNGSNTVRYSVDNIVYDPFTITYNANTMTWTNATLVNSWVHYTFFGSAPPSYTKDNFGRVTLRGVLASGTSGSVAFTLPAGFRPPYAMTYATVAGGAAGYVVIETNGDVKLTGTTTAISVDSLSFFVL